MERDSILILATLTLGIQLAVCAVGHIVMNKIAAYTSVLANTYRKAILISPSDCGLIEALPKE